jgi:hypothetical protein
MRGGRLGLVRIVHLVENLAFVRLGVYKTSQFSYYGVS